MAEFVVVLRRDIARWKGEIAALEADGHADNQLIIAGDLKAWLVEAERIIDNTGY